jgi:uncharacterized protein involved in oxidation of intracellular sulfur
MNVLIVINDAPYGSERCYNALRVAHAVQKQESTEVTVFLMADAISAAKRGQKPPEGYYSIERMLGRVTLGKGSILLCGTCMEARGIALVSLVQGARQSNMAELAEHIASADRVLTF